MLHPILYGTFQLRELLRWQNKLSIVPYIVRDAGRCSL